MGSVQLAIDQAPSVVGLAAKHLDSGAIIRHNADETFFTASTFKVPVLVELYRQVDDGKIDLNQRVEMTDDMRAPGGGVLKELGAGLALTVHDLAMLMTIISDNTATDMVYNMVGRDNLNGTMQKLGLTATHVPMNCRGLLFDIVGLDANDPTHSLDTVAERLNLDHLVMEADGFSEERSDVSSPDDMSRLFEMVYRGEILSPSSTEAVLDILKSQQLNGRIPGDLPAGTVVAHKTGTYYGVCCDVGIVFSPTGPYTVAIMTKQGTESGPKADLSLAAISRAVHDEFNG